MTQLTNPPLACGSPVPMQGFFTKRHTLGNLDDGTELERRLGFEPGSLALGWYVLYMVGRTPRPDEFKLGGYTHFSGGFVQGHKGQKDDKHVEKLLLAESVSVLRGKEVSAGNFTIDGAERLTKIYPVLKPRSYWHPDPNPVPQWQLTSPMDFLVASFHKGH